MTTFRCFFVIVAASSCMQLAHSQESVFNTNAKLLVSWTSNKGANAFGANDIYRFENVASSMLTQLLKDEELNGLLSKQSVLSLDVILTDQQVNAYNNSGTNFVTTSIVDFIYAGHEQLNKFDELLTSVVTNQNGSGLLQLLSEVQLVEPNAQNFLLSFEIEQGAIETLTMYFMQQGVTPSTTAAEKGLIAFIVILLLALIMVSSVLLWVSGGCIWVKSAIPWYLLDGIPMPYVTKPGANGGETETVMTSSSGILGATSKDEEENKIPAGFTHTRGMYRDNDDVFSPFSNVTNTTEQTNANNINPLGIISMRKLGRFETPEKRRAGHFLQKSRIAYKHDEK